MLTFYSCPFFYLTHAYTIICLAPTLILTRAPLYLTRAPANLTGRSLRVVCGWWDRSARARRDRRLRWLEGRLNLTRALIIFDWLGCSNDQVVVVDYSKVCQIWLALSRAHIIIESSLVSILIFHSHSFLHLTWSSPTVLSMTLPKHALFSSSIYYDLRESLSGGRREDIRKSWTSLWHSSSRAFDWAIVFWLGHCRFWLAPVLLCLTRATDARNK